MDARLDVKLGAIAGWIGFFGILIAFIAIPTALAGQPPTVNTDAAAVMAYFRHPEFVAINAVIGVFVGVLTIVVFGHGLRAALSAGQDPRARLMAELGLLLLVVTVPVYVISSAFGAMLVQAASGDAATFATLFRFYDLLYNGAADVLEGAWIGAFSAAILWSPLPKWIGWLGLIVMATRWIKAFIPVTGGPEAILPIGGIAFLIFFVAVVAALTRESRRGGKPATLGQPVPA